eukprot:133468_1
MSQTSIIYLVCVAIKELKGRAKGCSRQSINNYLVENNGKNPGAAFNAVLRNALKKGIESGVLTYGQTNQRFKLAGEGKSLITPKKKKKTPKKKTTSSKKKKKTPKRKSASKKKKTSSKKKKTTSKKRKTASKKKRSRK